MTTLKTTIKVKQKSIQGKWLTIARCYYPAHADIILDDCESRWPSCKFKITGKHKVYTK